MITAQQPRTAGSHRHVPRHRSERGGAQLFGPGETQVVIRREIDAARGLERPSPAEHRQPVEVGRKMRERIVECRAAVVHAGHPELGG